MSDEEGEVSPFFQQDESTFVKMVDRFYLMLAMTKLCSRSCGVLQKEAQKTNTLQEDEENCLKNCGENIKLTYSRFFKKVYDKIDPNIPAEENEEEGE